MARRFKRNVQLTISRVDVDSFFHTTTSVVIRDLRVGFSIEKSHTKDPNPCKLVVYNLSADSRAELNHRPLQVLVEAGYGGEYSTLFVGDLRWCQHTREGTEWVTRLELGDGARAYKHARVSKSMSAGASAMDVLDHLAKQYGLGGMPKSVRDLPELKKQLAGGYAAHGPVRHEMTRVLAAHRFTWSIQNGQLVVLPLGGVRAGDALLVQPPPDGTMIGTPQFAAPKSPKKPATLTVRMLLEPILLPKDLVRVKSESLSGDFKSSKILHVGDTYTDDWTTEVEATPK
jgi:hypothetical protein